MRKVSKQLKRLIEDGIVVFYQKAEIKFANGTEMTLNAQDFYVSGNSYSDGADISTFPVGEAMAKSVSISLVNDDDRFSEYDFIGAKITIYAVPRSEDISEEIKIGEFVVNQPESYGKKVVVTAIDGMVKGDIDYDTSITFPTTAKAVLLDSAKTCGVSLADEDFSNSDYVINQKPNNITHRQLWGYIAMLSGGNARMNENNQLQIVNYDKEFLSRKGLSGGTFSTKTTPYSDGDTADGGNFADYNSGDTVDGGNFEELDGKYHQFYTAKSPTIATDDVVITGIKYTTDNSSYMYGTDGYVLEIENPLLVGNEEKGIELIGQSLVGMKFRPYSLNNTSNPLIEFGDICYVYDREGNFYLSIVTDVDFTFFGSTEVKCSADSPIRNSSKFNSEAVKEAGKVLVKTQQQIDEVAEDVQEVVEDVEQIEEDIQDIEDSIGQINISLTKNEQGIVAEVSRATKEEESIRALLELKIDKDDAGKIISLINGSADRINFTANNMFTVNAPNLTIDELGKIIAKSITIQGGNIELDSSWDTEDKITLKYAPPEGGGLTINEMSPDGFRIGGSGNLAIYNSEYTKSKMELSKYVGTSLVSMIRMYASSGNAFFEGIVTASKFNGKITGPAGEVGVGSAGFIPYTDKSLRLGGPSYMWSTVYAETSEIGKSDRNAKKSIECLDDRYSALFEKLIPVSFQFIDGTSGRTHIGFISQDVEEAMKEVGLSDLDFAGFCKDEITDENGNVKSIYGLRYSEFIAINTMMIQRTRSEFAELKELLKQKGVI